MLQNGPLFIYPQARWPLALDAHCLETITHRPAWNLEDSADASLSQSQWQLYLWQEHYFTLACYKVFAMTSCSQYACAWAFLLNGLNDGSLTSTPRTGLPFFLPVDSCIHLQEQLWLRLKELNLSVDFQTNRWSQRATSISVWKRHPSLGLTLYFMNMDQKPVVGSRFYQSQLSITPTLSTFGTKKTCAHRVDTLQQSSKSKAKESTAGPFFSLFFL